jgi:hypothetical protein
VAAKRGATKRRWLGTCFVVLRSFPDAQPARHIGALAVIRAAFGCFVGNAPSSSIARVAHAPETKAQAPRPLRLATSPRSLAATLLDGSGRSGFRKSFMTEIDTSALQSLDARLVKSTHKGPTHVAGRTAFRGDILLTEAESPALTAAIASADTDGPGLSFLAGQLESFSQLPILVEAMNGALVAGGKYFIYIADVKRGDRYQIAFGEAHVYVLPYDDVSVYNELIDFFYLDKTKMKKFDTAAKIDALAEGAAKYGESFPNLTYEEGLARV